MNTFSSTSSSESPSPPLESQHVVTSLPSSPITTSIPIATTASASSSATTLEESSPRHFQHPSTRTQQQPLVSQVTKVCRKVQWKCSYLLGFQSLFLSSVTFSRTHDCVCVLFLQQITPEPIPLPSQLDSRENTIPSKPPLSNDQQNSPASLQPSGIPSPSLSGTNLNQTGSSSPLRPTLSSTMQKDITLETRVYQVKLIQRA